MDDKIHEENNSFERFEAVDEQSRLAWEESLSKLKNDLSQAIPKLMKKKRIRSAKIEKLSSERVFS